MWELKDIMNQSMSYFPQLPLSWKFWGLSTVKNGSKRGESWKCWKMSPLVGLCFLAPLWLGVTLGCEWKRYITLHVLNCYVRPSQALLLGTGFFEVVVALLAWSPEWLWWTKPSADSWWICSVIKKYISAALSHWYVDVCCYHSRT